MDGKQARKTKSSSALGMLFDHGCDAVNAGIMAIIVGGSLGTGWDLDVFLGLWCSFVPFYFQTWEEHYVGKMVLPLFNGPSEGNNDIIYYINTMNEFHYYYIFIGLLFTVYLCLCSAYNGATFYHTRYKMPTIIIEYFSFLQTLPNEYTYFELVYMSGIIVAIITAITQIIDVYKIVIMKNGSLLTPILGNVFKAYSFTS